MKAQKVLIHLGNVRDNDLASYAQKIVQRMTNNPNFTDPQPDLATPTLTVRYGNNPGEVYFEIGFIPQATEYLVLYSPTPAPADDAEWYFTLFSSTKGTLSHLKSGTKYVFKVTATSPEANKMNTYNFSNPIEKFVP